MSSSLEKSMIDRYLETDRSEREAFISGHFYAEPLRYDSLWTLLDLYSIDKWVFTKALEAVLAEKPTLDMALRSMVWIKVREADFAAAVDLQRRLVEIRPDKPMERRKLLRIGVVSPDLLTPQLIDLGKNGLTSELSRASYNYQIARAQRAPSLSNDAAYLRKVMHNTGQKLREQIRREAVSRGDASALTELLDKLDGVHRIALVGNGPSLRGQKRGEEIDRYEVVIRFNFPAISAYSTDVGNRTDIVVFTEALLREFEKRVSIEPVYRKAHLASVENPVASAGLDPDAVAAASGTRIARFPNVVHELVKDISYDNLTTGMMMYLLFCCLLEKNVTLFGFDFYSQPQSHYFGTGAPPWLGHEVQYERFVFRDLVKPVFRAYHR